MISTIESVKSANRYLIKNHKPCINIETEKDAENYIYSQAIKSSMLSEIKLLKAKLNLRMYMERVNG